MAQLASDRTALYAFRIEGGRPWFLLLHREGAPPDRGWEPVLADPRPGEGSARAAIRVLLEVTELDPVSLFALTHVQTDYDASRDAVRFMPCFAALVAGEVNLSPIHDAARWLSAPEAGNALGTESARRAVEAASHEVAAPLSKGDDPDPRLRIV
jgi:hypothetical protein